jgi:hypothetical protein
MILESAAERALDELNEKHEHANRDDRPDDDPNNLRERPREYARKLTEHDLNDGDGRNDDDREDRQMDKPLCRKAHSCFSLQKSPRPLRNAGRGFQPWEDQSL